MRPLVATYNYTTYSNSTGKEFAHLLVDVEGTVTNVSVLSEQLGCCNSVQDVITAAYEKWGVNFVQQLEGAFVIVIFDQEKRELLLFRDKIGVVPCYYFKTDHFFACSTSVKSLLELKEVDRVINKQAIGTYISYGYVQVPETLIVGVKQLLPAHYLKLNEEEATISSYWNPAAHFDYTVEGRTREQHAFHIQQLLEGVGNGSSISSMNQSPKESAESLKKWIAHVDHPSIHSFDYFEEIERVSRNNEKLTVLIGANMVWGKGMLYDTLEGFQSKRWLLSYPKNLRSFLSRWVNIPHKSDLEETYNQLIFQDYFDIDYLYPTYKRLYPFAPLQKSLGVEIVDKVQELTRESVVYQTAGFQFPYLSKLGLMELKTEIGNAQLPALYDITRQINESIRLPFLEWKRLRYFLNLPDEHKAIFRDTLQFKALSTEDKIDFDLAETEIGTQKLHQFAERKMIMEPFLSDLKKGFPQLTSAKRNKLNTALIILESWLQENEIND